jgi:hypothetical protein
MELLIEIDEVDIVVESLKKDYLYRLQDIRALKEKATEDGLLFHQVEDYNDDMRLIEGIKTVLSYYMINDEYRDFIREAEIENGIY